MTLLFVCFLIRSQYCILKAYPKAFLQMTYILNHKKMTGTFCWAQPSHSCSDWADKKKCWHLYWDKSRSSMQEAGLMTIRGRAAALCAHGRPALSLTSGFCVCVCRESYESWLAFPAWLSLKEPMNCCIKWVLQAVVFSIPTGETRVSS